MRRSCFLLTALLTAGLTAACSGSGGERTLPASPVAPGDTNSANITAPVAESPSDDQQLDSTTPTLRVTNATSSGSGSRTYEFQIADEPSFAMTAPAINPTLATTFTRTGVPEGSDGRTSFTVASELFPATRYYWRARAQQGGSIGPWSNTLRFKTRVASFKGGNRVFDIMTDGVSVADDAPNVSFLPANSDPQPGGKLNAEDSYILYRLGAAIQEGEISFIARRVKPGRDGRVISMQDGTGDFNSNPFRVRVDKATNGVITLQFAGGPAAATGGIRWLDNTPYYFKLEWRSGTARLRVWQATAEGAGGQILDLSATYTAPYNAAAPIVVMGGRNRDTHEDIRVSRLYVGPTARPIALTGSEQ